MWLAPFFDNPWLQDAAASLISFSLAFLWLKAMESAAKGG